MSWWAPIAAAGINYFGQRSANQTNARIASDASQMSQANAREQMAFQERMSNTAHQRAVRDLRAAGLNPILAARQPASSPGGAMGQVFTYQHQNVARAAIDGYQIASQSQASQASAQASTAQAALSKTQANKVRTEIIKLIPAQVRKMDQEGLLAQAGISVREAEAKLKSLSAQLVQMDKASLEKMGLSSMQMQYKPSNQVGSMIINEIVKEFGENPKLWQLDTKDVLAIIGAM